MRMRSPARAGLVIVLLASALAGRATAETVHGRVTFVGTLGDEQQPDGSRQARFRFRFSESSCGTTDGLWTKAWTGGNWTAWQLVSPAPLASKPAAVARAGIIGLFALGTDNHIYTTTWDGTRSPGWTVMGAELFSSGPAVAKQSDSRIDLFARGMADNALWWNTWTGTWSGWSRVSTFPISSDPAAVSWGPGRIDVFARGMDNGMYQLVWNGSWSPTWQPLGGVFSSGPGVASWAPGRLDVFGRGTDNALWTSSWNGVAWSGWTPVAPQPAPQPIASDPAAVSVQFNRVDIFARRPDNQLHTFVLEGTGRSGWTSLGPERFGSGPAVAAVGYRTDLFVRGAERTDRWFHVTSGKMDGAFEHNQANFRNAYNTLLSALLARTVTSVQIDGVPGCDETQVQTFALDRAQIGLYP
jgi:hypothetical protein